MPRWNNALALVLLACGLLIAAAPARAQLYDLPATRPTLKGLPGVSVLVIVGSSTAQTIAEGLQEQLTADVERQLRLAGIRVLTRAEAQDTAAQPVLIVDVQLLNPDQSELRNALLAFHVGVGLFQRGILAPPVGQDGTTPAPQRARPGVGTWGQSALATSGFNNAREAVRTFTRDVVHVFVTAWLSVNPKT